VEMDLEREEGAPTDSFRFVVRELSCLAVIPVEVERFSYCSSS